MTTCRGWKTHWSTLHMSSLLVKQGNMTWKRISERIPSAVYPKDFGTWHSWTAAKTTVCCLADLSPTIIHPLFYI